MDWSGAVSAAVTSASSIVGSLTQSANDQKKAVSAAKKAGKAAQKNAEKLYPNWDLRSTKRLAESEGISTRAEWKRARAQAGQEAYQAAYDEVWQMYVKAKDAEINSVNFQTSQEYLDHELAMAQTNAGAMSNALALEAKTASAGGSGSGFGCSLFAVGLAGGGCWAVCELANYLFNLI